MAGAQNSITVDILADGTIRVTTGQFAGPVHMNAEQFMQFIERETGNPQRRVKKAGVPAHTHDGIHFHQH